MCIYMYVFTYVYLHMPFLEGSGFLVRFLRYEGLKTGAALQVHSSGLLLRNLN